jgi:hypothetical protein
MSVALCYTYSLNLFAGEQKRLHVLIPQLKHFISTIAIILQDLPVAKKNYFEFSSNGLEHFVASIPTLIYEYRYICKPFLIYPTLCRNSVCVCFIQM